MHEGSGFDTLLVGDGQSLRLHVRGDIDAWSLELFSASLDAALADPPFLLIIDLAAVGFMGAYALDRLVEADDRARALGVAMVVVGAAPSVRRVFEIGAHAELLERR